MNDSAQRPTKARSKPRISLLSLLLIPATFAAGWWAGTRSEDNRVTEIESRYARKLASVESVAHALNAATFINLAFQTTDISSPQEQLSKRKTRLINEILFLARAEPHGSDDQQDVFLMHADNALALLRVENFNQFIDEVTNASLTEGSESVFLDSMYLEFAMSTDFVRRTFARCRSLPSYLVREWIRAIDGADAELLAFTYTKELRSQNTNWMEQVELYRTKIHGLFGETKAYEFGFGFSTLMESNGEVQVFWQG